MPDDAQTFAEDIRLLKERNLRVEADKAWETSWFRAMLITVVTYLIATAALMAIGNSNPLRNALIPALGYFLSTQSFPFIKRWWIIRRFPR